MEVLEIGEQQPERRVVRRELPISCVLVVIGTVVVIGFKNEWESVVINEQ